MLFCKQIKLVAVYVLSVMLGVTQSYAFSPTESPLTALACFGTAGILGKEIFDVYDAYKKDPKTSNPSFVACFKLPEQLKKMKWGRIGGMTLLACVIALIENGSSASTEQGSAGQTPGSLVPGTVSSQPNNIVHDEANSTQQRQQISSTSHDSPQQEQPSTHQVATADPAPLVAKPTRAQAAVLNAAIGDALGRVTEFVKTNKQNVSTLSQARQGAIAPYTDDTVMALIVLEECLEGRKKNSTEDAIADALAHRFAALFGDDKMKIDPLYGTRAHGGRNQDSGAALNKLIAVGHDTKPQWWRNRSNKNEIKAEGGCGSVMRAWPIGLVFAQDREKCIRLADEQSVITHGHPMARASSAAMAVGIACAHTGMSIDATVAEMIRAAEQFDAEEKAFKPQAKKRSADEKLTPQMLAQDSLLTSDMIRFAYQQAKAGITPDLVLGIDDEAQANYRSPHGFLRGWAADEAIAAAVYLFVRNGTNVRQAIIEGVNTPGDSDSIATLAGALVGAYAGTGFYEATDAELALLENKDKLCALAAQI